MLMQPSAELLPFPVAGAVRLNVGGEPFLTTVQTLASQCAYFGSLCSDEAMPALFLHDEQGGAFFIDRDAAPFRSLLTFLRSGIAPAGLSGHDRALLLAEAHFYGCEALIAVLEAQQQPKPAHAPAAPLPMRRLEYKMATQVVDPSDAFREGFDDEFLNDEAHAGWKVQQLFCETTLLVCRYGHEWSGPGGPSAEGTSGNCPKCGHPVVRRRKGFAALMYRETA